MPIYMRVYMFDIQNGFEVTNNFGVPVLQERGPYTFFETREKKVINFTDDATVINYNDLKTFTFVPELSNGTLDDVVNYINIPLVVSAIC